jgi:hypothetical protein
MPRGCRVAANAVTGYTDAPAATDAPTQALLLRFECGAGTSGAAPRGAGRVFKTRSDSPVSVFAAGEIVHVTWMRQPMSCADDVADAQRASSIFDAGRSPSDVDPRAPIEVRSPILGTGPNVGARRLTWIAHRDEGPSDGEVIQAGEGIRTPDPLFTRQVLYQLSYSGIRQRLAGVVARLSRSWDHLARLDAGSVSCQR